MTTTPSASDSGLNLDHLEAPNGGMHDSIFMKVWGDAGGGDAGRRALAQYAFDLGRQAAHQPAQEQAEPVAWRVGFDLFNSKAEAERNVRNPRLVPEPLYRTASSQAAQHESPRTELSKRIRSAATADLNEKQARLLIGAAEEIERWEAQQAATADLCIGFANNDQGAHVNVIQSHPIGSFTVLYQGKVPLGDSFAKFSTVPVVRAQSEESAGWGRVDTVGDLVRNLLTLDQVGPIFAAFHTDLDGKRVCRTRPVTISRERVVDGKWVDPARTDVPYAHIVWAKQDEPARAQQAHAGADEQTAAARDVLAERQRQVVVEGRTPEGDDGQSDGHLAVAAGYYALACGWPHERDIGHGRVPAYWPWAPSWWKPRDKRSNLVRSGALVLAEIERLDRAAIRAAQGGPDNA